MKENRERSNKMSVFTVVCRHRGPSSTTTLQPALRIQQAHEEASVDAGDCSIWRRLSSFGFSDVEAFG